MDGREERWKKKPKKTRKSEYILSYQTDEALFFYVNLLRFGKSPVASLGERVMEYSQQNTQAQAGTCPVFAVAPVDEIMAEKWEIDHWVQQNSWIKNWHIWIKTIDLHSQFTATRSFDHVQWIKCFAQNSRLVVIEIIFEEYSFKNNSRI